MGYHQTIVQITKLNNEGAEMIEVGDLEGAITCFATALKISNVLFHDEVQQQQEVDDDLQNIAIGSTPIYKLDQIISFTAATTTTTHHTTTTGSNKEIGSGNKNAEEDDNDDDETSSDYIFRQPFRIDILEEHEEGKAMQTEEEEDEESKLNNTTSCAVCLLPETERTVQTLAAITMFNFGLAFHLSGIQNHDRNCTCLGTLIQTAVRLYEYAFEFQNRAGQHSPSSAFYFLAILNNLSHAHLILGNQSVADKCSLQLLSTMMYLVDSSDSWQDGHAVQMPPNVSFDNFFRSTYRLILRSHGAAAA